MPVILFGIYFNAIINTTRIENTAATTNITKSMQP